MLSQLGPKTSGKRKTGAIQPMTCESGPQVFVLGFFSSKMAEFLPRINFTISSVRLKKPCYKSIAVSGSLNRC